MRKEESYRRKTDEGESISGFTPTGCGRTREDVVARVVRRQEPD